MKEPSKLSQDSRQALITVDHRESHKQTQLREIMLWESRRSGQIHRTTHCQGSGCGRPANLLLVVVSHGGGRRSTTFLSSSLSLSKLFLFYLESVSLQIHSPPWNRWTQKQKDGLFGLGERWGGRLKQRGRIDDGVAKFKLPVSFLYCGEIQRRKSKTLSWFESWIIDMFLIDWTIFSHSVSSLYGLYKVNIYMSGVQAIEILHNNSLVITK